MRSLSWGFLGSVPYRRAEALQQRIRADLAAGTTGEHLLGLEHPHVFTVGRNASRGDLLVEESWLAERGVEVAECDRGGQMTYHGPGQLVVYPVIDLNPDRRDLRAYVHDLQEVIVRTAAEYGVAARPETESDRIGVWVGGSKLASIGVHVSRWLTTHGLALNVNTDLEFFGAIVPCGLPQVRMCSIESLTGKAQPVEEVAAACARHFAEVFGRRLEPVAGDLLDSLAGDQLEPSR